MLDVEAVVDDVITHLRVYYPGALAAVVAATDQLVPVAPPPEGSYYPGEWSLFESYRLPACFVVADNSTLRLLGDRAGANLDIWDHAMSITFLVEGVDQHALTRACWRMARAAYDILHDRDVTRAGVTSRGTTFFVRRVDYGPVLARTRGDQFFRQDVTLSCTIAHRDQATP